MTLNRVMVTPCRGHRSLLQEGLPLILPLGSGEPGGPSSPSRDPFGMLTAGGQSAQANMAGLIY